jgi:hypothetical protein
MSKYAQKILHFYCYTCKDYELKTSTHYSAQKERFAKRRKDAIVPRSSKGVVSDNDAATDVSTRQRRANEKHSNSQ